MFTLLLAAYSLLESLYLSKVTHRQFVMPNANCLMYSLCQLGTAQPSLVQAVQDMPQLEEKQAQAQTHATHQSLKSRVENNASSAKQRLFPDYHLITGLHLESSRPEMLSLHQAQTSCHSPWLPLH